jgi:putative flippase GtrA
MKCGLLQQAVRFGVVGVCGMAVDMGALTLFHWMGWVEGHLVACKVAAAELAVLSNYCGNEFWAFRDLTRDCGQAGWRKRLVSFHVIYAAGIAGGAWLLRVLHVEFGWNLWFANLTSIGIAACWNFTVVRLAWMFTGK